MAICEGVDAQVQKTEECDVSFRVQGVTLLIYHIENMLSLTYVQPICLYYWTIVNQGAKTSIVH